ncbi:MAG: lipase family alpha/beta hydrolase [Treponema sp.]
MKKDCSIAISASACKTRYPLFFVHGMGFRDNSKWYPYWGRIPERLKAYGADIFFSNHDCVGTIHDNAVKIKARLDELISTEHIEKVNIIAHSKGGIESRYLISSLGAAAYTASLTTFASPHRGVKAIHSVCRIPFALSAADPFVNAYFKLWGDKNPQFKKTLTEMSFENMEKFNTENPNDPNVRYFSYAAKIKNALDDPMFCVTFPIVKHTDGDNDGLIPIESAQWGVFKGIIENAGSRGISHADAVDIRRSPIDGFDITDVYVKHIEELKRLGL